MTNYEFGQAVMKAAGVEPELACRCSGCKKRAREGEAVRRRDYPDPLTPEGFCALWDALVQNGFFVRVCSPIHGGIHIARVYRDGSPEERSPGVQHDDRVMALLQAAAQALGVTR